jgi:hypothetical protein
MPVNDFIARAQDTTYGWAMTLMTRSELLEIVLTGGHATRNGRNRTSSPDDPSRTPAPDLPTWLGWMLAKRLTCRSILLGQPDMVSPECSRCGVTCPRVKSYLSQPARTVRPKVERRIEQEAAGGGCAQRRTDRGDCAAGQRRPGVVFPQIFRPGASPLNLWVLVGSFLINGHLAGGSFLLRPAVSGTGHALSRRQ